mgnify:CR=1 FL=1
MITFNRRSASGFANKAEVVATVAMTAVVVTTPAVGRNCSTAGTGSQIVSQILPSGVSLYSLTCSSPFWFLSPIRLALGGGHSISLSVGMFVSGVGVSGASTFAGDIDLLDNNVLSFGTDKDLRISHAFGSNSITLVSGNLSISDSSTNSRFVLNNNANLEFKNTSGTTKLEINNKIVEDKLIEWCDMNKWIFKYLKLEKCNKKINNKIIRNY